MIPQLRFERRMVPMVPWGLILAVLAVSGLGVWNVASATRAHAAPMWTTQLLYVGVGVVAVACVALVDYRFLHRAAVPIYVVNLILLVLLKFIGHKAKGAESWIALGPFRLQPAEFMKIGMILMLARYFHDDYRADQPAYGLLRLLVPGGLSVLPIGLVLVQPDLGTALMMTFTAITVMLFARVKVWLWATMLVAFLVGAFVIWHDYAKERGEGEGTIVRQLLKPHQDRRISSWLDPESDIKGASYHAAQSKIAVGSGGLWGKGWMQGTQTGYSFLPEQHTDFIFSVWAEEHGFMACLLLLALYAAILLGCLGVAFNARDRFGAFVAVGITAMIFWQVFENIGMVTGLLPVTGITLPLMSYGGSSMLSVMVSVGLLVNISVRRHIF